MAAEIPKYQIEKIVGWMHVGDSDDKVRAEIRRRAGTHSGWTEAKIREAEEYAVKVHHQNRGVYSQVMGGSGGTWRGRKPKSNPSAIPSTWKPCQVRRTRDGKVQVKISGGRRNPYGSYGGEVQHFRPRWIAERDLVELANLWATSRTAKSGRWERMNWTADWFQKEHPKYTKMQVYKDLDAWLQWNG